MNQFQPQTTRFSLPLRSHTFEKPMFQMGTHILNVQNVVKVNRTYHHKDSLKMYYALLSSIVRVDGILNIALFPIESYCRRNECIHWICTAYCYSYNSYLLSLFLVLCVRAPDDSKINSNQCCFSASDRISVLFPNICTKLWSMHYFT